MRAFHETPNGIYTELTFIIGMKFNFFVFIDVSTLMFNSQI